MKRMQLTLRSQGNLVRNLSAVIETTSSNHVTTNPSHSLTYSHSRVQPTKDPTLRPPMSLRINHPLNHQLPLTTLYQLCPLLFWWYFGLCFQVCLKFESMMFISWNPDVHILKSRCSYLEILMFISWNPDVHILKSWCSYLEILMFISWNPDVHILKSWCSHVEIMMLISWNMFICWNHDVLMLKYEHHDFKIWTSWFQHMNISTSTCEHKISTPGMSYQHHDITILKIFEHTNGFGRMHWILGTLQR